MAEFYTNTLMIKSMIKIGKILNAYLPQNHLMFCLYVKLNIKR